MNGDIQSELYTLEINQVEKLDDFHIIILRHQQKNNLFEQNISPTILLLHYTKEF